MNYMPPGFPPADPLAPAKRAGLLMIVLGSLGLLCGTCFGLVGLVPIDQIIAQQAKSGQALPPGITPSMLTMIFRILAGVTLVASLIELVLGFLVRRGSAVVALIGIVFSVIIVGYFTLNTLYAVSQGTSNAAAALFMGAIFISAFAFQIVLLVQAKSGAANVAQRSAAYAAQYWQHLNQQQAYQQPIYNPAAAPVTLPPPPAYGAGAYNAPAVGAAPPQTGWQWPPPGQGAPLAPPPPPPASAGDSQDAQGPQA